MLFHVIVCASCSELCECCFQFLRIARIVSGMFAIDTWCGVMYPLAPIGVVMTGKPYAKALPIFRCVPDPCVVGFMKAWAVLK